MSNTNRFSFNESFLGFIDNCELLPKDFDEFTSTLRHRQLFLALCNNMLDTSCKFSKYEQKRLRQFSLKEAFHQKIKSLLPNKIPFNKKQIKRFNFCKDSTKVINSYKIKKSILIVTSNKKILDVAKLISLCYVNNKMQFILDKNLLFHEFVLHKIKKLHKDKTVKDHGDSISITGKDVNALKIYTSWKNIQKNKPDIKDELEYAIKSIKKENYSQVYLVYPKANDFKRHIPVYVDELKNKAYVIKAIPYSLRSTIR
ncbi:hypothetical protein [Malaciobacter marinus]|uniref:hypothetical protein n=1 Tax=Malaciobacter marinus TaxID=505249 RepID=UPI003B002A88